MLAIRDGHKWGKLRFMVARKTTQSTSFSIYQTSLGFMRFMIWYSKSHLKGTHSLLHGFCKPRTTWVKSKQQFYSLLVHLNFTHALYSLQKPFNRNALSLNGFCKSRRMQVKSNFAKAIKRVPFKWLLRAVLVLLLLWQCSLASELRMHLKEWWFMSSSQSTGLHESWFTDHKPSPVHYKFWFVFHLYPSLLAIIQSKEIYISQNFFPH